MTHHIPGPWYSVGRQINSLHDWSFASSKAGSPTNRVAHVYLHCDDDHDKAVATARLIAASPELLDCTRQLLALFDNGPNVNPTPEWHTRYECATDAAIFAIGKAVPDGL